MAFTYGGWGIRGTTMTNIPETRVPIEARMVLTASQYSQIAATYEHAAADLTLPPQPRAAFAEKANDSSDGLIAELVSSYGAATLSSFSRYGHSLVTAGIRIS